MAEEVKKSLPENKLIGDIAVSPQGFLTVKVSSDWMAERISKLLTGELEYHDPPSKRVVVDFSSPNIAKEMHVGHLRSTIIGESTCRILEFCGHEVHRLNHVGDWGTQFGMLIEYMREAFPNFENELPAISDLQEFYKAAKKRFDEDEAFKEKSRLRVVSLQGGDEASRVAWQKICDVSRAAFQVIYDRLDITCLERGESYYNELIPWVNKLLRDQNLLKESDGAMCVFTPKVAE